MQGLCRGSCSGVVQAHAGGRAGLVLQVSIFLLILFLSLLSISLLSFSFSSVLLLLVLFLINFLLLLRSLHTPSILPPSFSLSFSPPVVATWAKVELPDAAECWLLKLEDKGLDGELHLSGCHVGKAGTTGRGGALV